jgi:hypothetical protein
MAEKKKRETIFIHGVASYPKTNKPYKWDNAANRSVPDPEGEYENTVIVDEDEKDRVEKLLAAFAADNKVRKPSYSISEQVDEDDEPTGKWLIKAKQYGTNKDGTVKRIAHFDGAAKPLPKDFILTSGSEIIMAVYPSVRTKPTPGVKLNISAVQVLKYVEMQERNPFEAQQGAWTKDEDNEGDEEAPFEETDGEEDGDPADF